MRPRDHLDMRFTSDHYWNRYVRAAEERWPTCPDKEGMIWALCGREDVAKVMWSLSTVGYYEWFIRPNSSIGGQTPMELLSSGTPEDENRLRALLMQQPV